MVSFRLFNVAYNLSASRFLAFWVFPLDAVSLSRKAMLLEISGGRFVDKLLLESSALL